MTTLAAITHLARLHHLRIMGALHEGPDTIVLLGPDEPGFWTHVNAQPEMQDARANPLDSWSKRAIGTMQKPWTHRRSFPRTVRPMPFHQLGLDPASTVGFRLPGYWCTMWRASWCHFAARCALTGKSRYLPPALSPAPHATTNPASRPAP